MAEKSLGIAGSNVENNVGMLHHAYALEMQTSYYFQGACNRN
jgi:hypothetical protein